MKKIALFLMVLLCGLFFFVTPSSAQTIVEENGFQGKLNSDDTVSLTKYPKSTSVKIPDTIDGYVVTKIEDRCFYLDDLEMVEIPASVKEIGDACFEYCKNLKSVVFTGPGLEIIGNRVFFGCSLEQFEFPSTVNTVGSNVFGYVPFQSVTIPASVTTWGNSTFLNAKLQTVTFEEGTTTVPDSMFSGCSELKTVNLASTIETIEKGAFSHGGTITELVLPESLKIIEENAFYGTDIQTLVAPCKKVQLDAGAFYSCLVSNLYCAKDSTVYQAFVNAYNTKITITGTYLSKNQVTTKVFETVQLKVVNGIGQTKWKSSNTKVAKVSDNGVVTGVSKGTAVITAKNNGVQMQCTVEVKDLELNQKNAKVTIGFKTKLILEGGKNVKWSSSNKKIATVKQSGVVTGKKKGSVTITATCNGQKYKCKLQVMENKCELSKYLTNANAYPVNTISMGFREVAMNSKGDLVLKGDIMNHFPRTVSCVKDLTIYVYNGDKCVAKQTYQTWDVNVSANASESISLTINKKNVKKKYCDLRTGKIRVEFKGGGAYSPVN
ncbi:MAG: leucine-rich repeat protein [Eubacteriales bacterium]|nr:leucine-rich repeat protein [Eubacteriales bacterium]